MDDESVPVQVRLEVPLEYYVFGALAQLGERLLCTQEVRGSSPLGSTKFTHPCFTIELKTNNTRFGGVAQLDRVHGSYP
jgi:hypothetical protein